MTAAQCTSCGRRPQRARGWCNTCYMRWDRAGRPNSGPPAPKHINPNIEEYVYRIGEYAHLLACGESRERAAERLGVTIITARKYDQALQKAVA